MEVNFIFWVQLPSCWIEVSEGNFPYCIPDSKAPEPFAPVTHKHKLKEFYLKQIRETCTKTLRHEVKTKHLKRNKNPSEQIKGALPSDSLLRCKFTIKLNNLKIVVQSNKNQFQLVFLNVIWQTEVQKKNDAVEGLSCPHKRPEVHGDIEEGYL